MEQCMDDIVVTSERWSLLMMLAQSGDPEAQWELGYHFEYGADDEAGNCVVEMNVTEALRWYETSAEQGYAVAQGALSRLLSSGNGITPDYPAAIHWAKQAIAQGDASAAYNLGTIYRDQQKYMLAMFNYQQAAEMGDLDAQLQLGLCHMFGIGTKQNLYSAMDCFSALVEGDPSLSTQRSREDAQYWMAVIQLLIMGSHHEFLPQVRTMLERANHDDDHEQANLLLNLIGKSK